MRKFVAVFEHGGQKYYAMFNFIISELGVEAHAEYVRKWPSHDQLDEQEGCDVLDASYQDFAGPMGDHIQRELKNEH